MTEDQIIARAALIAASEHYNTMRKRHGRCKKAWAAYRRAKAVCAARGV